MMTKTIFAVLSGLMLISTTATTLTAQTPTANDNLHSTVQVSLFPPLGTNGTLSKRYTNDFSLNVLAGLSENERVLTLGGLANVVLNDARGAQLAGLVNYTGGVGYGIQASGLANVVRGDFDGLQFAGLLNTARNAEGLQYAGLANAANNFEGAQLAGLANAAQNVRGAQFAGLVNMARDVRGVQFGGLVNMARDVRGVQFAGLVNVARRSDYPVGLVNIIREGEMGIGVGYNEIGTMSVNFRSGGRVLYGILGMGYNHNVDGAEAIAVTGGYGAHINITPRFRINNELTSEVFDAFGDEDTAFKAGYALLPAFRIGNFEIFGGPSINYLWSEGGPGTTDLFLKNPLREGDDKLGRPWQFYIGWQIGMQFLF